MNRNNTFFSTPVVSGWMRLRLPLLALFLSGNAWAANPPLPYQDFDLDMCTPGRTYNAEASTAIEEDDQIIKVHHSNYDNVFWQIETIGGDNCVASGSTGITCFGGINITVPADDETAVPASATASMTGMAPPATIGTADFSLRVTEYRPPESTDDLPPARTCLQDYKLKATSSGGGWGDPHITTVDGVNYDFQSAGEFISLLGGGLEIQTRQTAVATTTVPNFTNAYTGLKSCVSIYTAVAARVGAHRVSYQPNISGVPDPSGMQLRVDGVLTELGPDGINLGSGETTPTQPAAGVVIPPSGDRIVKTAVGDGIEIHYADGAKLVVTPAWWAAQQKWYLNVNVYQTTATQGIMGSIAPKSWLPALADGASVGPKPDAVSERYAQLYAMFGNSWRVTDATSLFDYAPGTSTATFTLADWPRENPASCAIEGEPAAEPIDVAVAEKHCEGVADANNKANCIFDVAVTSHAGFAEAYQLSEQLVPGTTVTTLSADKNTTNPGENLTFTATVAQTVPRVPGAPAGKVQFVVDGSNAGNPVALDANGKAAWSTANLQAGTHQIVAKFNRTLGFGEIFLGSSSPALTHTVTAPSGLPWWLIILLIIILVLIVIWKILRGK